MRSILYVGIDVHKESYIVCSYSYEKDALEYQQRLLPDYKLVLKYLE